MEASVRAILDAIPSLLESFGNLEPEDAAARAAVWQQANKPDDPDRLCDADSAAVFLAEVFLDEGVTDDKLAAAVMGIKALAFITGMASYMPAFAAVQCRGRVYLDCEYCGTRHSYVTADGVVRSRCTNKESPIYKTTIALMEGPKCACEVDGDRVCAPLGQ
jgi:hypothetical protein